MNRAGDLGYDINGHILPVDTPRQLTPEELRTIDRLGFHHLARALAAGTCFRCGLNRDGRTHRELCEKPDPLPAPTPIRQPWQPRAPRDRRAA